MTGADGNIYGGCTQNPLKMLDHNFRNNINRHNFVYLLRTRVKYFDLLQFYIAINPGTGCIKGGMFPITIAIINEGEAVVATPG